MKIHQIHMENFKKFRDKTIDFCDEFTGQPKDLIVLVGDNGSGKSTVLQAIAAMLGTATKQMSLPSELEWPGLEWDLADRYWPSTRVLELTISFTPDELTATKEYFSRTRLAQDGGKITYPGDSEQVQIRFDPPQQKVMADSFREFLQFQGRYYASLIIKHASEGYDLFKRIGDIYAYHDQRTFNSFKPLSDENGQSTKIDIHQLRNALFVRENFHKSIKRKERVLRQGERDAYAELETLYKTVFPGRSFYGTVPASDPDSFFEAPYFYLYDGTKTYEIAEMSSGERAIFPIIFDFAIRTINNSIILIDEIELHLHPPLQQALVSALPKLGKNNQFIITTHSDAVATIVPSDSMIRL